MLLVFEWYMWVGGFFTVVLGAGLLHNDWTRDKYDEFFVQVDSSFLDEYNTVTPLSIYEIFEELGLNKHSKESVILEDDVQDANPPNVESKIDDLDTDKGGGGEESIIDGLDDDREGKSDLNEIAGSRLHIRNSVSGRVLSSKLSHPDSSKRIKNPKRVSWFSKNGQRWTSFHQSCLYNGLCFSNSFWMTSMCPQCDNKSISGRGRRVGYYHTFNNIMIGDRGGIGAVKQLRTENGEIISLSDIDRRSLQGGLMMSKTKRLMENAIIVHLEEQSVALIRSYGKPPLAVALLRLAGEKFVVVGTSEDNKLVEITIQSGDIVIIDNHSVIHNGMETLVSDLSPSESLEDICEKVHGNAKLGLCVALRTSTAIDHGSAKGPSNKKPIMSPPRINAVKKMNPSHETIDGRAVWFRQARGKWKAHHHHIMGSDKRIQFQFKEAIIMSNRNVNEKNEKVIYRNEQMGCEITEATALISDGLVRQGSNVVRDKMGERMVIPDIDKKVLQMGIEDSRVPMISDGIIVHLDPRGMVLIRSYGLPPLSVVVLRVSSEDGFKVVARSEDDQLVEVRVKGRDIALIGSYWDLQNLSMVNQFDSLEQLCLDTHRHNQLGICVALRIGSRSGDADSLGSTDSIRAKLLESWFVRKGKSIPVVKFGKPDSPFREGILVGKFANRTTDGITKRLTKFGIRASEAFLFVSDDFVQCAKREEGYFSDLSKVKISEELLQSKKKFKAKFPLDQHGIMVAVCAERLVVRSFGDPPLTATVLRRETEGDRMKMKMVLTSEPDQYGEIDAKDGDVVLIVSCDHGIDDIIAEFTKNMDADLETVCKELFKRHGNQRGMILAGLIRLDNQ